MSTFTSLNNRTFEFTDNRSPRVVTDFPLAFDISANETDVEFTLKRSIEIVDFVKPDEASLVITIDTRAVDGVNIVWDSLPAGVTVNNINGLYFVNGVDSVEDWDAVKEPTITVPSEFQGIFFYTVRLEWTTTEGIEYREYTVGEYVPVSNIQAQFALEAESNRIAGLSAVLISQFAFEAEIVDIPLFTTFEIECEATRIKGIAETLPVVSTLAVSPEYIFTDAYLSTVLDATYIPLIENDISTDAPRITLNNEVDPLTVEIFSTESGFIDQLTSDGYFSYQVGTITGSFSGTFVDFINNGTSFITKQLSGGTLTIRRYSYPSITLERSFTQPVTSSIPSVAVSEDGSTIAIGDNRYESSGNTRGRVFFYTLSGSTYSLLRTVFGDAVLSYELGSSVGVNSNGTTIIAGTAQDKVDVYNISGTRIGSIAEPSGTSFFGQGDGRIRYSKSGNRFIISGNNISTGRENNYLYTITNFSPLTISQVSLTAANTFLSANSWFGSSDFSIVGVENKIYNSSGSLRQTFADGIDGISPDGTHIAIEDGSNTKFVYTGNSSTGWTYQYNVESGIATTYLFFKQDNSELFNVSIRRILQDGSGVSFNNTTKVLTLTGTKSQINESFGSLALTPNNVTGTYEMNYKLIAPSITYTRRQDFTDE
jgi:hypothetical protein